MNRYDDRIRKLEMNRYDNEAVPLNPALVFSQHFAIAFAKSDFQRLYSDRKRRNVALPTI